MTSNAVERTSRHHYTFRSTWSDLPASRAQVVTALADVGGYASWWPEIKSSELISEGHGRMALRSVLPFTLRFTLRRLEEDRPQGVLRSQAEGDIAGTVEWHVTGETPGRVRADFHQSVDLNHRLARPMDAVLRPVLEWNHAMAMRSGVQGLIAWLNRG